MIYKIYYKCNNCKQKWIPGSLDCPCYKNAFTKQTALYNSVKEKLEYGSKEYLDYSTFLNSLTDEEKKQREENNKLFALCSYENSVKYVVVKK